MKLNRGEDGYGLEIGDRPCEKAAIINFSIIAVADELNFIGYSEKMDGPGYVNVQMLVRKPQSPQKPVFDPLNLLFGGGGGGIRFC